MVSWDIAEEKRGSGLAKKIQHKPRSLSPVDIWDTERINMW